MARLFSVVKFFLWLAVAIILVWFAANNTEGVLLRFHPLGFFLEVPPWLILFAGIFIGLGAAAFATSWRRLQVFAESRRYKRERDKLGKEVAALSEEAHTRSAADARGRLTDASVTGLSNPPSRS